MLEQFVNTGTPTLPLTTRHHSYTSYRERDDCYAAVVIHLTQRWRIIVCKDGIQWILQQRSVAPPNTGTWSGKSYPTTRDALIAACSDRELLSAPSARQVLNDLPDRIGGAA